MNPIPQKHRKIINSDPYYKVSCISGKRGDFYDPIEIHHAWIYGGKQISELWNYMPLKQSEHEEINGGNQEIKNKVKLLSIQRAGLKELKEKYPKRNWIQEYNFLINITMQKKEKKEKNKIGNREKICPKCKFRTPFLICHNCGSYVGDKKQ